MSRQPSRGARPRRSDVAAALAAQPDPTDAPATVDAVHLRNDDHRERHSVAVTVLDDGEAVLADRHALAPGQSTRVGGSLASGTYELLVHVDGVERVRRRSRLGPGAADTAVVELGNGAVSVTTGAAGSLAVE